MMWSEVCDKCEVCERGVMDGERVNKMSGGVYADDICVLDDGVMMDGVVRGVVNDWCLVCYRFKCASSPPGLGVDSGDSSARHVAHLELESPSA